VDAVGEEADLLQDGELVLHRQDLRDLAVLKVPDRRVAYLNPAALAQAYLDFFAGRAAPGRAG
jgi:hypothetical protein